MNAAGGETSATDARLAEQVRRIEDAMRELRYVSSEVGAPRPVSSAFGIGEMPFRDWLACVFLPRARQAAASGEWPTSSQVGTAAIRNLDGLPECEPLIELLCELDGLVNARQVRD